MVHAASAEKRSGSHANQMLLIVVCLKSNCLECLLKLVKFRCFLLGHFFPANAVEDTLSKGMLGKTTSLKSTSTCGSEKSHMQFVVFFFKYEG